MPDIIGPAHTAILVLIAYAQIPLINDHDDLSSGIRFGIRCIIYGLTPHLTCIFILCVCELCMRAMKALVNLSDMCTLA